LVSLKNHVWGLFKKVQMQGAQETAPRGVYKNTLSEAVLPRNTADELFVKPSAFSGKDSSFY
jgi:hypothetical protein